MKRIVVVFIFCFCSSFLLKSQQFPNPLLVPDTLSGTEFNLEMISSEAAFFSGTPTETYGINQDYLGPTLIMQKGDVVQMHVTNHLGEAHEEEITTMHWHGMHVAPEDDGGPHTPIYFDSTWSPEFEVLDEATTFWYHPHLHHHTAEQVYYGAAGMILVRDENPVGSLLPHHYGIDEYPLIFQDKSFDANNQFEFTILADTMMVNGTLGAHLNVPAQMVRFHLLNASMQRVYNFGFPPNIDVWQIGSDGGFLERILPANRMTMSPGERIEIVVDFASTNDSMVLLRSFSSELEPGLSGGPGGGPRNDPRFRPNPLDSADFDVMEFRIRMATPNAIRNIPMNLNTYDRPSVNDVDRERTMLFTVDSSGFPFYINGRIMDLEYINDTVLLDDTEIWTIINHTDVAHPWHIHDIQFFVLDINGVPPPPNLAGRKDVITVNAYDTIRYITKFDDFTNDTIPYMYHCHNLFHEDGGMMGQFIVTNTTGIEEIYSTKGNFKVYPNPSEGLFQLRAALNNNIKVKQVEVRDVDGKNVKLIEDITSNFEFDVDLSNAGAGIYFIQIIYEDNSRESVKVIKQ